MEKASSQIGCFFFKKEPREKCEMHLHVWAGSRPTSGAIYQVLPADVKRGRTRPFHGDLLLAVCALYKNTYVEKAACAPLGGRD